jgi:Ca-activated chloride channel family protein
MKFAQPIWLLAGLIACAALIWRYRRFDARQRTELKKFASESLIAQLTTSVSPARRQLKRALVVAGVACLALALARPLVGFRWDEAKRKGLNLLFAVDTSRSMLAQDVKPDRLTRAKMAVEDLLAKMDGDRVGLIAFAGNAFLQCPLTLDYDAFRQSLDVLDTKIIPRGGTDIASAIHEAEAALEGKGNNERILVLLTDGEDLEGSALEAARAAAKNGLKIFTVGIGSANGELIPVADEKGGTEFVKDASGQFVKSHLDETMLKQIAEATGAMYQPLGQQAQGLETIYQKGLAKYTRHELASRMTKVYIERFQWPLGLGMLCLVLEPLIGIRRLRNARRPAGVTQPALFASWNRQARPARGAVAAGILPAVEGGILPPGSALEHSSVPAMGRVIPPGRMPGSTAGKMPAATPARAVAAAAAALAVLGFASAAHASARTGEKAFQKGDYPRAEQEYRQAAAKSPDKPVLQYNLGAAAYKSGDFNAAAQSFTKAMKTDDLKLQQDDYYNLGNTQYRIGQKTEQANTQETIKNWEQAVQSYDAALQLKTDDADAKYNRDLVKRKLEAFKKQQQNQQNNQQQSQDKNQQNKDQNKQNDSKDQQKQQNKDQSKQDQKSGSSQDQKQPGQKKEDQRNGASGQQPKQEQANQKPEPKNQDGYAGQKPDQAKKDGQLQARNPQPKDAGQDQADAQREPGQMSREEARQLLDSLKSWDRKMPLEPSARDNAAVRNDEPLKDW